MINPWLNIPSADYENHMREAGQLRILQDEFFKAIEAYQPKKLVVIGAATGNGFQFINSKITREVHAVDINPDYLTILKSRYEGTVQGLKTHICNIDETLPQISASDLVFAALVFEYTDITKALVNVSKLVAINGKLVAIIQKSNMSEFVTKSSYKSLEKLIGFSEEVDIEMLLNIANNSNLILVDQSTINVSSGKYFVKLVFGKV